MKVASILGLALALVATPATSAPAPGAGPDPGSIHIESIAYGGSGCPQGSATSVISEDKTNMTMIFQEYIASIGPGVPPTENRKNCQLNVHIRYPAGFQYSILSADYRGYALIEKDTLGTLKSSYYFSGDSQSSTTQYDFPGPFFFGDYVRHAQADSTTWSPCGYESMLNINSQVRLVGDNKKNSRLSVDSVDLKFTQILHLQWREC